MIPVDQTTFGHPGGNCFSACVASLLELDISEVPYFMNEDEGRPKWHEQLDAWLGPRGFYAVHFTITDREVYDRENLWPKGFYILGGKSSRGDHAVVARGSEIVHDPHPSREGIGRDTIDGLTLLVPNFDTDPTLQRLRDIVDEYIGLQPVLGYGKLLDAVEGALVRMGRERFVLREAVHQMHIAMPPAALVSASRSPCVREALDMVTGADAASAGEERNS